MNNKQLQKLVEEISLKFFFLPFKHQASFNSRLRTIGGRYLTVSHNIEINPKSYEIYGLDELIGIIKHELCHYHLHIQGHDFSHRSKKFRELLIKVNGTRYSKPIKKKPERTIKYLLICKSCKWVYPRKRKIDPKKYRCSKCGGELELMLN